MKKAYQKPGMNIVHIQSQGIICSSVKETAGNAGLIYGGGNSDVARSRGHENWGDED